MLARFIDDDFGYLQWLRDRPGTFVLETERDPRRSFVVVHRAECPAISGPTHTGGWTTRMIKVCATTLEEINSWCQERVGGHATHCQRCHPAGTPPTAAPSEEEAPAGNAAGEPPARRRSRTPKAEAAPPARARRAPAKRSR